jgi:hypothetical protein
MTDIKVGSHTGKTPRAVGQNDDPLIFVLVRPELMVAGNQSLLEPPLTGKARTTQPAADLMSLLSGRGRNLIWFVFELDDEGFRKMVLPPVLAKAAWPEGDEPRFLMLRLCTVDDDKDAGLQVEGVLRHAKAGEGVAASEAAMKKWLATLPEHPHVGSLGRQWEQVVVSRERADLTARWRLGAPKDAAATIAVLAYAMLPVETRRPLKPAEDAGRKE